MAAGGISADLRGFGTQMQDVDAKFAASMRRNVRKAVNEAGGEILTAVRANASWSTRIPAATTMATSFAGKRAGVKVKTSAAKVPYARAYELGSKNTYDQAEVGRRVSAGVALNRRAAMKQLRSAGANGRSFRHPVFGGDGTKRPNAPRVEEATRPYFFPAVEKLTPATEARFASAVEQIVRDAGFR